MVGSDDFLAPRKCFLPPIPELDEAAELLSQAADCLLAGNAERARDLIRQADMPTVRAYAASVMGPTNRNIHRFRTIPGLPAKVVSAERAKLRRPSAAQEMAVFERDGYRCRYCGCHVVLAKARAIMMTSLPDTLQWGNADRDKHAAFYALSAVADHFIPHARGGSSEADNLLTTCQSCNYGRNNWLIEEVGLIDPWTRPPVCDGWDGLGRLLPNKRRRAAAAVRCSLHPA